MKLFNKIKQWLFPNSSNSNKKSGFSQFEQDADKLTEAFADYLDLKISANEMKRTLNAMIADKGYRDSAIGQVDSGLSHAIHHGVMLSAMNRDDFAHANFISIHEEGLDKAQKNIKELKSQGILPDNLSDQINLSLIGVILGHDRILKEVGVVSFAEQEWLELPNDELARKIKSKLTDLATNPDFLSDNALRSFFLDAVVVVINQTVKNGSRNEMIKHLMAYKEDSTKEEDKFLKYLENITPEYAQELSQIKI
ncbi:hypothetical protein DZF79_28465 [Vibrio parahaemolyticus]|nr:hypothetical protein [Vibrio parahaemolyticus]